jgi:hypothetical protein
MGTTYNRIFGGWLAANGMGGITPSERYRSLLILENLPAIEAWRADEAKRRRFNHPGGVWHAFRLVTRPTPPGWLETQVARTTTGRLDRIARPSGDVIRRIATALRGARSNDYFILAEAAYFAMAEPAPMKPAKAATAAALMPA